MSENPLSQKQDAPASDHAHVEDIAQYLGATRELTERLQLLREEVHETLNEQFQVVATDLEQLRGLLGDAANKLSSTFRVITAGTDELSGEIAKLSCDCGQTPEVTRIREISVEMTNTTGTTIQSLQFEDMASQLLAHVNRRLDVLQAFSKDMAVINPTSSRTPPYLDPSELDRLFEMLANHRASLKNSVRKAVQQQSLESGDIELF